MKTRFYNLMISLGFRKNPTYRIHSFISKEAFRELDNFIKDLEKADKLIKRNQNSVRSERAYLFAIVALIATICAMAVSGCSATDDREAIPAATNCNCFIELYDSTDSINWNYQGLDERSGGGWDCENNGRVDHWKDGSIFRKREFKCN